jgi:DNA polymerase-3 subunit delta
MASSALRALKTALETREFDPAYLFHGDDDFLKEEKVRAVIERATDPATRAFNVDVRRGSEVDRGTLAELLGSPPMMAEHRVVVVRDVSALKKDARAGLAQYLGNPAHDTVLLLLAAGGTKPDADLLARTTAIEFKPLNESDLVKWAEHYGASLSVSIEPGAAELLCRATGNDLALLSGEIDKLRSYTNGSVIDEAAVAAVVGVRHGESLGDLLELIAARQGPQAAALLERILAQPKITGVSVLMALTTQTLAIGWLLAARARGLPAQHMERELFALLKANPSSLVGRPWGEGVKSWVRALKHWDETSIDRVLELLLAADTALKETRISSDEQLLTTLVLSMAASAKKRAA